MVLNRLADFTEAELESKQRVQQAMVYPVIILFALTVAILAGLLGYVVPDIVKVFSDTGQDLPALTVFIIGLSDYRQGGGPSVADLCAVAGQCSGCAGRCRCRRIRLLL